MDIDIVRTAYRKLKSHIYYDNSNLLLRMQLAEYESSGKIDEKLIHLSEKIDEYSQDDVFWSELFSQVSSWRMVKQYDNTKDNSSVITNLRTEEEYRVDRVNHFINAPFELHICAAIWLCQVGYQLEPRMSSVPFGNKLELKKERDTVKLANGLRLYRPYFKEYQSWRDQAVSAAKDLVEKNKNALILGLDIKDFYHSVRIDTGLIHESLYPDGMPDDINSICDIFSEILLTYTKYIDISDTDFSILPIGLISSGVLANYYLDPLDKQLNAALRPEFYGRYVDDILIVVSCHDDKDYVDQEQILKEYLLDTGIFNKDSEEKDLYSMTQSGYASMKIQSEKLATFYFSSKEPAALLDKFVAEMKKNSSEYRLLPEDEVIEHDFDMAAYNMSYSGAGNKLRDIKEFGEDRFGVSKYLAKKIFLALQSGYQSDPVAIQKIVRFFRGKRAVELYALWEKAFTFMLLNKDYSSIFVVVKELVCSVGKITRGKSDEWNEYRGEFYLKHIFSSLSMALSLKPSVLTNKEFIERIEAELRRDSFLERFDFKNSVKAIRTANLVRHSYIIHPLLNYVRGSERDEFHDLINNENNSDKANNAFVIDPKMYRYSPRFVHFHEVTLFHIINRVTVSNSLTSSTSPLFKGANARSSKDYLNEASKDYFRLNYQRSYDNFNVRNEEYLKIRNNLFKLESAGAHNDWTRVIKLYEDINIESLRVAVANFTIHENAVEHEYLRKPIIEPERRKALNEILNQAEQQNVDLMVMPEISVPVAWLGWVAEYARTKQRALVFGLEHWVVGKNVFNFLVTLMPTSIDGFKSLVLNIRLKNHYSPAEIELLEGYGYSIPKAKHPYYDLFMWRGCHFTTFNCFELSNIEHRSRFRSKVDLLVASEFNKDISYFSNIVESSARDIHCYVLQVNDSRYGDSRVTQPAERDLKDLIKVKGGKNPTILVDTLNLKLLREFQIKEYSGQKKMGGFKPTPPDFDKQNVLNRIG